MQGIPVKDLEDGGFYKYVQFKDGTVRFCHTPQAHSQLVKEGEEPTHAGFIGIYDGAFKIIDERSSTLNLGPVHNTENMQKVLNRKEFAWGTCGGCGDHRPMYMPCNKCGGEVAKC